MTRRVLSGVAAIMAACSVSLAVPAQGPVRSVSVVPATASMEEVRTWIEQGLAAMGNDIHVLSQRLPSGAKIEIVTKYQIDRAVFSDCRLSLRSSYQINTGPQNASEMTVAMRDLDVDSLVAGVAPLSSNSWTENKPRVSLRFRARLDRDEPFTYSDASVDERTDVASVQLRDMEAATQAIGVFRRAAMLCANTSPSGAGIMTNAEIIRLAAAGLSDQVVITAIRQAPAKQFDLSPEALSVLKKSRVSDAVVLVMLAPDTAAPRRPLTSARARRDSTIAARAAFVASMPGMYYRHGNTSDYVQLMADGTFLLKDGRKTYRGSYTMNGTSGARFVSDGSSGTHLSTPTGKAARILSPGDSVFQCGAGPGCNYVRVASTTINDPQSQAFWERQPTRYEPSPAGPPKTDAGQIANPTSPTTASGCADVDFLGVFEAVTGGGLMAGVNAYGARIRNRATYTKVVTLEFVMNGVARRGTVEVRAGEIANANLGRGSTAPTNARMTACK